MAGGLKNRAPEGPDRALAALTVPVAGGAGVWSGHPLLLFPLLCLTLWPGRARRHRPAGLADAGFLTGRVSPVVLLAAAGGLPLRPLLVVGAAAASTSSLLRLALDRRRRSAARRHGGAGARAAIVGRPEAVKALAELLARHPEHGLLPVLTATPDGSVPTVLPGVATGVLPEVAAHHLVTHVVVAGAGIDAGGEGVDLDRVVSEMRAQGMALSVVPACAEALTPHADIIDVRGIPFVTLPARREQSGMAAVTKRVADVLLAAALLLALSPLLLLIAAIIRLDSRGPAFFRQARVGRDGREFRMWKFRSMVVDAEARLAELADLNEASGPFFKMSADPRVTRVGRWLRRTYVDELPQLLNVLAGHMSLVGPRPVLPGELAASPELLERRRGLTPGMTGLWQLAGRSWLPFEEGCRMDRVYAENWSLGLDLLILLRTLSTVVKGDRRPPADPAPVGYEEVIDLRSGSALPPVAVDVSIIVVTHESAGDIEACLASIDADTSHATREVIVVDNASADGTAELVAAWPSRPLLIRKTARDGFSRNCNIGAAAASGRHLLFLNPDTVLGHGVIDALVAHLAIAPGVGAVAPRLVYPDGSAQPSARRFPSVTATLVRRTPLRLLYPNSRAERRHLMLDQELGAVADVDWVLGAAVMVPGDVYRQIGGFDEHFRLYCEDIDLCWRVHEAGWRVQVVSDAQVVHRLGEATRKRFVTRATLWHIGSMVRFVAKHGLGRPRVRTVPPVVPDRRPAGTPGPLVPEVAA